MIYHTDRRINFYIMQIIFGDRAHTEPVLTICPSVCVCVCLDVTPLGLPSMRYSVAKLDFLLYVEYHTGK